MKIVVVGIGYVGLANAILLAQNSRVIAVDICQERVDLVNAKCSPIDDPEIKDFLLNQVLDLSATVDLHQAVSDADFVIIATPTNYNVETDSFDTASVEENIEITLQQNPLATIVVKSTIPVGFIESVRKQFGTDRIFFSPEFLREGRALYDNLYPSRIVVGDNGVMARKFVELLLTSSKKDDIPVLFVGPSEAESIKLFANTYLAMRVSYFNELDSFALAKGLNSKQVIDGISLDPRIGNHYNNPSFGYGGYCLPKDTKQLLANFKNVPQALMSAIVESNDVRMEFLTGSIMSFRPKTVGIYRLIMKAGSDNLRHSSVQGIISRLKDNDVEVIIYEPSIDYGVFNGCAVYSDIELFKSKSEIIVANRDDDELTDVLNKVFTRNIYDSD